MRVPTQLASIDLAEFAARIAVHSSTDGGLWGLMSAVADLPALASELAREIEFIAGNRTCVVPIARTADATLALIRAAGADWVILCGFPPHASAIWAGLDQLRNHLQGVAGLVFLLSAADLQALQVHAPNLSSWLGGRIWRLSDAAADLSPAEVEQRLTTLRAALGKSDAEVVAAARNGELPSEPEYAEWLILLGHGGLIA